MLNDPTVQSAAFLPIAGQCNYTLPMSFGIFYDIPFTISLNLTVESRHLHFYQYLNWTKVHMKI